MEPRVGAVRNTCGKLIVAHAYLVVTTVKAMRSEVVPVTMYPMQSIYMSTFGRNIIQLRYGEKSW